MKTNSMASVRVLCVDDSKVIRLKVSTALASDPVQAFEVQTCSDGKEALEFLCGCPINKLPDIIILDRNMPNMTGDETIRILRKDDHWKIIPILFLTAQEGKQEIVRGLVELRADDYLAKPFDDGEMIARVKVLIRMKKAEEESRRLNVTLERQNRFIRQTFGRYLSDEVVDTILESKEGMTLGGEKRVLTIMMTDLRGFTTTSERYPAEVVVSILNAYLETMTEILLKYNGVIDEFIGDAILALFGAPTSRPDDARRAVACALEMQRAMEGVNKRNAVNQYPRLHMGIGINTGQVVVGNIGSHKRTKYGVVGSHVNLASRIESYTIGGQVLISSSTQEACGGILDIGSTLQVNPKGVKETITLSEVVGIRGKYKISLPQKDVVSWIPCKPQIGILFVVLSGKDTKGKTYKGTIHQFHDGACDLKTRHAIEKLDNLKLDLLDKPGKASGIHFYGKVTDKLENPKAFRVAFTSISDEARHFLKQHRSVKG